MMTMKTGRMLLLAVATVLAGCHPPQPASFTSARFRLSYVVPQGFHLTDPNETKLPSDNDHELFLFGTREGVAQEGIIAIAEKLGPGVRQDGSTRPGIADGADFLNRVEASYRGQEFTKLRRTRMTPAGGFAFEEMDYKVGEEYDAAMVADLGDGYLFVARANATTAEDLRRMTESLLAMRKTG